MLPVSPAARSPTIPQRRRDTAVGGYTATAVLTAAIGVATAVWQVAVLRAGGWAARGLRVPSRNALLADVVPASAYGRAYGFERAMDNLGAIGGPLLALALVALVGVRTAILLSVIPGLLAAVAIVIAIRSAPKLGVRERRPLRIQVRPVLRGRLGRLFFGVGAFEVGNAAATLLILRATELLEPGRGHDSAVELALLLYAGYNLAATLASIPGGQLADRRGNVRVLALGVAAFLIAYLGFAPRRLERSPCWRSRSSRPGSGSASSRRPNTPRSPRSLRTRSAAPPSDCSPQPSLSATSPPARSRARSGRSYRHGSRSSTSPSGCS